MCGTDQSEFSPHLHISEEHKKDPQYLAVSDWYCDLVRSDFIELSTAKLDGIDVDVASLSNGEKIADIAAVVLATGFDPNPCINFLPKDVLVTLQHSPEHVTHPLALAFHGTHHPDVPGLGFVGFYRSPYWGVMQMQSRVLARLWSTDVRPAAINEAFKDKLDNDDSIQRTLNLRGDPRASQFPMGDYQYLMQEMAAALSIPIVESDNFEDAPILSHNNKPLDVLTPARYPDIYDTPVGFEEAAALNHDTVQVSQQSFSSPQFVSRAIFRSLLGTWSLERDLTSQLPSHPSGHFSGTAQFLIREKTTDVDNQGRPILDVESDSTLSGPKPETALEYLYIENGEFKTDNGFSFNATRRYVWRYDEMLDKISVWFVKPDDLKRADYLFHEIDLHQPEQRDQPFKATSGHLCIDDYYDVSYEFFFKAINLREWNIEYTVHGPKKDYKIRGTYTRPKNETAV